MSIVTSLRTLVSNELDSVCVYYSPAFFSSNMFDTVWKMIFSDLLYPIDMWAAFIWIYQMLSVKTEKKGENKQNYNSYSSCPFYLQNT